MSTAGLPPLLLPVTTADGMAGRGCAPRNAVGRRRPLRRPPVAKLLPLLGPKALPLPPPKPLIFRPTEAGVLGRGSSTIARASRSTCWIRLDIYAVGV